MLAVPIAQDPNAIYPDVPLCLNKLFKLLHIPLQGALGGGAHRAGSECGCTHMCSFCLRDCVQMHCAQSRCGVHTLAVPIAQDLNAMYAGADAGAIAAVVAKLAVEKSLHGKLDVRLSLKLYSRANRAEHWSHQSNATSSPGWPW